MRDFWHRAVESDCLFFRIVEESQSSTSGKPIAGYRTNVWSNYFGTLQDTIRQKKFDDKDFNSISVDITSCDWIDPIPLLSLVISLAEFCADGGKCHLKFSSDVEEQKTLLPFLSQEGFFQTFKDNGIHFNFGDNSEEKNTQILEKIGELQLSYTNSSVLPAMIIDLKNKNIDTLIIELLDKQNKRPDVVPSESFELMYMKLYHILYELIDNIKRHAYKDDAPYKFAGVYIRYRYGIHDASISEKQKKNIEALSKIENECHLTRLPNDILKNNDGIFEVFVVDSGVGIEETLKGRLKNPKGKPYSHPFLGLFQLVWFHGLRNAISQNNAVTPVSGINLIHNILTTINDFVFAHEGIVWIGFDSAAPKQDINYHHAFDHDANVSEKIAVKGLSWIFRVTWKKKNIRKINYVNYYSKNDPGYNVSSHPVFTILDQPDSDEIGAYRGRKVYIVDERGQIGEHKRVEVFGDAHQALYFLWFPKKSITKNKIIKQMEDYAKNYQKNSSNKEYLYRTSKRILIILDIPSHEIPVYKNALGDISDSSPSMKEFFSLFDRIVVCTNTYEVIAFCLRDHKLKQDQYMEDNFLNCRNSQINIKKIAYFLKSHDTYLFWKTIDNSPEKSDYFLNANIKWDENMNIKGFFYFENIINSVCL